MSILTEAKYLDEITFSGGNTKDEDCADIADWTTDGDTGAGVSSQVFFDSKSCFSFNVVTAGAGNVASRTLDIGAFATPCVISVKLYHETLGTLAAGDYFEAIFEDSAYRLSIRWASDGLYIYDGSAWNEVGTNLVVEDTWQEWTFNWTVAVAGVVAIYLDGVLQAASADCSHTIAGTDGNTTFRQYGTTVIGKTYTDWIKVGTAFRYGGETWLLQEGGQLTIRTDTRWHKNSPASMLGSLSTQTVTEGKLIYDGTDVRWLAITGGSGTPAIGDTVTQGAVSGYYLGYWSSLTAAPALAIGATGFIKFREVTGGAFAAGALTFSGAGAATAAGADVAGWIEIVADSASTITVPRLGEHEIVGDWFYLDNTDGTVGQVLQVPTNGGGAATFCPGAWIETASSSGVYEYWPSLYGATNGWARQHIGAPFGGTDARQNFVKDLGSGQLQIGEAVNLSCTYINTPSQASTYTAIAHSCTYAVVSNICIVTYTTGHLLQTGHIVGVDFTSGGATALDANFTITVLDAYRYSFALVTADTSGNATARPGLAVSFASNTLGVGDTVYCDFTSGGGTDGDYEIYAVASTTIYYIKYPTTAAVTSGNVTVYSRYTIIYTGAVAADFMNLTAGNRVYLDFTSGSGTDGTYTVVYPTVIPVVQASTYTWAANVVTVTFSAHGRKVGDSVFVDFTSGGGTPDGVYTIVSAAANTFTFALTGSGTAGNCSVYHASFDVIANNNASADAGNVTVKMTIGNIPASGCKTRIPNVFLREAATATRASNRVDAAIASRPEWATTSAGAIDMEYAYSTWYHNFGQPYSVRHKNVAYYDSMIISECATALDLDNCGASMYGALDAIALSLTSNFAGGTIQNSKFQRGNTPSSSDHAISANYCIGLTFDNLVGGIIQYARSSGYPFSASYGSNLTLNNFKAINGSVAFAAVNGATVNDLDYTDAYMGYGRVYSALYAVTSGAGSVDILVDGITVGFNGTIPNVSPPAGLVYSAGGSGITFRNIGTFDSPIPCGTFRPNAYAMAYVFNTGGNNYNIRYQRIYIDNYTRSGAFVTINSDKLVTIDSVQGGRYVYSAMAIFLLVDNGLNSVIRGARPGANAIAGVASVYGSHFTDMFVGDTMGRYVLPMNEPTAETTSYFTMVAGTRKFNSVGGILMGTVGDQAVWEDAYFRKGHTGFQNTTPTMTGGTIGNYTVEYDIDVNDGNGFTNSWTTASGANLSGETIDPVLGFRLKIRITTLTANLTAITFLRIDTTSTAAVQEDNLYDLDVYELTLTGFQSGSDIVIYAAGTTTIRDTGDAVSSYSYEYATPEAIDIGVFKAGYVPFYIRNYTLLSADASLPIAQVIDRAYLE